MKSSDLQYIANYNSHVSVYYDSLFTKCHSNVKTIRYGKVVKPVLREEQYIVNCYFVLLSDLQSFAFINANLWLLD